MYRYDKGIVRARTFKLFFLRISSNDNEIIFAADAVLTWELQKHYNEKRL